MIMSYKVFSPPEIISKYHIGGRTQFRNNKGVLKHLGPYAKFELDLPYSFAGLISIESPLEHVIYRSINPVG